MKKLLTFITFLVLILTVPLNSVFALNHIQSNENVILEKDQIINSDYFAAGESVTIRGTVNGDVYAVGGKVTVDGEINGDLLVAGGDLNLRGKVSGSVRAAGGQIIVTSIVGKNVSLAGGSINIADTAKIGGNLVAGAGDLNVYSEVGGDITAGAGALTVGNRVGREINAGVGEFTIASSATVLGDINYWSNKDARIETGASLSGKATRFEPTHVPVNKGIETSAKFFGRLAAAYKIISILSALIVGLILIRLVPIYTQNTAKIVSEKPLQTLGLGFIVLCITPILIVILLITIVGIPLAFVLLAVYLLAIYFSKIFVAVAIGSKVLDYLNKKYSLIWALVVGILAYAVVTSIPILGGLAAFLALLMGLGSLAIVKFNLYKSLKGKDLV